MQCLVSRLASGIPFKALAGISPYIQGARNLGPLTAASRAPDFLRQWRTLAIAPALLYCNPL